MKQILQNLENGYSVLEEIPGPHVKVERLLITTTKYAGVEIYRHI
jgi:hypothetical protein